MERDINVQDLFYSEMYEILTNGKAKHNTPVSKFAQKNFDSLMKKASAEHTSLPALEKLQSLVEQTQEWSDSKKAVDKEFVEYQLSKKLIPWQKDLFTDESKRVAVQCGRRTGKTVSLQYKAVRHCLDGYDLVGGFKKPRAVAIIGLTKTKCADQYWDGLKTIVKESRIPFNKMDNAEYYIELSNGATISLLGNASKAEREKIRGDEYSLIIIDEMQSQKGLRYLMENIVEPIAYGRNSQIICSGTGALALGCYWQDITDGKEAAKWRHYHYTMVDNPTISNHEEVLAKVREEKGWTEDDPEYIREYLGQNAYDASRLILPNRKYYKELPTMPFVRAVVGIDFGFEDSNAIVPLLVAQDGRRYAHRVWKQNKIAASEIVKMAKEIDDYLKKELKIPSVLFVADTSDQSISQDIWNQGVNIKNAYKVDEKMQWSKLKERMSVGDVLIEEDGELDEEAKMAVWKYDEEKKEIVHEVDDDFFHPDALDALRYANYWLDYKEKK